jgi:nitrate reductase gamma subunit
MNAVLIVAIVFGSILLALTIIGGTILSAIRLRHGGVSRKSREADSDETRMIQEIYQGLSQMEKRVENLETILMDEYGKERKT